MIMTSIEDPPIAEVAGPGWAPSCRLHGSLQVITDSERRSLRSIGCSAGDVATWTRALLADLFALPGVHIFQGVRPAAAGGPRIPHVVSAGRQVILVESVAWPAARYAASLPVGRVLCDGVYIGQSVRPLIAAVRYWRELLPDGHQVSALVVVHKTTRGELTLPPAAPPELAWARAEEAALWIQACLPDGPAPDSPQAVDALIAATVAAEDAGPDGTGTEP